jgi:hypothetical protein
MAGSWKYEVDWADKASEEGDEQAFNHAPPPEDLEAHRDEEGEEADPNCEGIITDESPEHWEHEFAPMRAIGKALAYVWADGPHTKFAWKWTPIKSCVYCC